MKGEATTTTGKRQLINGGQRANLRGLLAKYPHLKTIEDATEPIQVNVTPKDQKGAKPWDLQDCAMARACKREQKIDGVYVQLTKAYLITGDHAVRYQVPESVSREIVSFDRHTDFALGTYRLSAVPKASRIGKRDRQPARPKTNGDTKPRPPIAHHRTARVRG